MKETVILFLSFLIQTAIATTNAITSVNESITINTDTQNNSPFSDTVSEAKHSIPGNENTHNNYNRPIYEHDITTESGILFEESSPYDPPVYIYRGGVLYSNGKYCHYPYSHIRSFGNCPYYQRFGFQMRFKDVPNAREKYLDHLFNQAYLGNTEAQFKLGVRYRQGMGVSQNLPKAYAWFNVALQYGHNPAQYMLDTLASQMTAYQVEEGDERTLKLTEDISRSIQKRQEWFKNNILNDFPEYQGLNETKLP